MHQALFPTNLISTLNSVSKTKLEILVENHHVLALCDVDVKDWPVLLRMHQRTLPILGRATVWLTHEEIIRRLNCKEIIKAHKVHLYEQAPIFRDYIEALWNLRLEFSLKGDEVGRLVTKLLMNSLYGKFGQKGADYQYLHVPHNLKLSMPEFVVDESGEIVESRHYAGGLLRIKKIAGESHYSHPAIAATVTALARWRLWDFCRLIGLDDIYYTDTDSILTSLEGFLKAKELGLTGTSLGDLKTEFTADCAWIHGKKDYCLYCDCKNRINKKEPAKDCKQCGGTGVKTRLKGISPRAIRMSPLAPEAAVAIAAAGLNTDDYPALTVYLSERPQNMTQLFHGQTDGKVQWQEEIKVLRRKFRDGIVQPGGRTAFFTLHEGDAEEYALDRRGWLELGN